jgi:hypothetical protein
LVIFWVLPTIGQDVDSYTYSFFILN